MVIDVFVPFADGNECTKASAQSCGECIQAGEKCGWCMDVVSAKPLEKEIAAPATMCIKGKMLRDVSCARMICLFKCVTIAEDILSFNKQFCGEKQNLFLRPSKATSVCNVLSDVT